MQRNLGPLLVPFGAPISIATREFGRGRPQLTIVGGLHGDSYNSLYICHLLIEWLRAATLRNGTHTIRGRVRVLPAINPVGLLVGEHAWPFDHTDLDRVFPGYAQGETTQRLTSWVLDAVRSSNCCVVLHSDGIQIEEWPQILVYHGQPRALELAKGAGLPLIRLQQPCLTPEARRTQGSDGEVFQGTLSHTLLHMGIDVLTMRAGVGMRLNLPYCRQVFASLVRLALQLGVVNGPPPDEPAVQTPQVITAQQLQDLHSRRAGLLVTTTVPGQWVEARQCLAQVLDPLAGEILEEILADRPGYIAALRSHPVILEGSLIARLAPP